ncbi:lysine N(6)-hydroxylase/L-ornithine N(5)-oxygenase family protein [Kocuria sp. HSID16901]|uniref:lysine N(6)-hydroxylase/L-ornithine N(5)-oxygenase family protein n=1 Tax=Kocuria sp. HSID16901 TaxID=2419505 RepID=UPI000660176A|nr:SidA/IucD/PvdA family monooxygenase [Kocuria sp. HSID16901]MCT1367705.1 SidA/IucD/PvdA family monooxygenase [Rothia sp. p3-SID1597]RUQ20263.1 L-lysine 6-monooxygenase [Kocuria sp. HSID16901]
MNPAPTEHHVYDLIGIGIGPFNLGLACLSEPLDDVEALFLDENDGFAWHHGVMFDDATIQVPFMADMVTMADPASPYSFLNWLKQTGRLYSFYIREDFHPLRREYDAYCRWVAGQLPNLRWQHRVESVEYVEAEDLFLVTSLSAQGVEKHLARNVVTGIGTGPRIPEVFSGLESGARHSSRYLYEREEIVTAESIAVVGSGQSAAEIYLDLLSDQRNHGYQLDWITRSPRFFPMEDTKLTLELTSPEYVRHFHSLPESRRDRLGREQRGLYKGISMTTIDDVYEALYRESFERDLPTTLLTNTAVIGAEPSADGDEIVLSLHHEELGTTTQRGAQQVIMATGYAPRDPEFLRPVEHLIRRDEAGRFDVDLEFHVDTLGGRLFVQNAEEHTHGLTAPDLGMGPWRNAIILKNILGREVYPIEHDIAFQTFGLTAATEEIK